jgi:aquaporin related protein
LAVLYIISEVIGAVFGYGMLKVLTPNHLMQSEPGLCVTSPHSSITTAQAFFLEFFLTFALVFVVSGAWDPRNKKNSDSVAIKLGELIINENYKNLTVSFRFDRCCA